VELFLIYPSERISYSLSFSISFQLPSKIFA